MKTYLKAAVLLTAIFCLFTGEILSQTPAKSTDVIIRAQSKDAKFIGTSMGGAFITIEEVKTGEILAKGFTEGSTGDTQKLMRQPTKRYDKLSTPGAAKFETTLNLSEPTFVTVTAVAPYAKKQARVETSTQLWLIPGKLPIWLQWWPRRSAADGAPNCRSRLQAVLKKRICSRSLLPASIWSMSDG